MRICPAGLVEGIPGLLAHYSRIGAKRPDLLYVIDGVVLQVPTSMGKGTKVPIAGSALGHCAGLRDSRG